MFEALKGFADLGSTVIITLAFLFVFYESQKKKKNGFNDKNGDILSELKLMNVNHLNSIEKAIREGNKEIVQAINNHDQSERENGLRIIEKLSEFGGKLK